MPHQLFDMRARAQRRDRASRTGPVLFVHQRAFADILDRLADIRRPFASVLMVGVPNPRWADEIRNRFGGVTVLDPGAEFATAAGGEQAVEDVLDLQPAGFDLCIAIGTLDTVNDLPGALLRLRLLLKPDSLLIGAMAGGETLPRLRQAMRAADSVAGPASPHVHPRVEPAGLAQLLSAAGFVIPVVDVDRVRASYANLLGLVADLRGMAATNVLAARSRTPLGRRALAAAEAEFLRGAADGRVTETFELLHFAAWTPAGPPGPDG